MSTKATRRWSIGAILVGLSGCAGVSVQSLRPVASEQSIELAIPFGWNEAHDTFGRAVTFRYTLAAGRYRGKYMDANGTYYAGPPLCMQKEVTYSNIEDAFKLGRIDSFQCGVYLPSSPGSLPRVYYFNPLGGLDAPNTSASAPRRGSGDTERVSQTAQSVVSSTPSATPLQAGIGAGIGAGIAGVVNDAMIDARRVNIQFLFYEPDGKQLAKAITK